MSDVTNFTAYRNRRILETTGKLVSTTRCAACDTQLVIMKDTRSATPKMIGVCVTCGTTLPVGDLK